MKRGPGGLGCVPRFRGRAVAKTDLHSIPINFASVGFFNFFLICAVWSHAANNGVALVLPRTLELPMPGRLGEALSLGGPVPRTPDAPKGRRTCRQRKVA